MTNHPRAGGRAQPTQAHADIEKFFGGDADLYAACRAASMAQLPVDLLTGNQAASAQDLVTLHRTTHSLKSVMLLLGWSDISNMAAACEDACARGMPDQAKENWAQLARQLDALISSETQRP